MPTFRAVLAFLASAVATIAAQQRPADLGVVNARIYTGVPTASWAEVLVISGDRIVAVGSNAEYGAQARAASRVIDARGRLVVPGFNDAHVHPTAAPEHIRLEGPPAMVQDPSWDDLIQRIKQALPKAPKGVWILGEIGAAVLQESEATRFVLDAITGDHPVALKSWHGHGVLFNAAALRLLKVSDTQPDPPGGFFARMPDGKTVTGLAHETQTGSFAGGSRCSPELTPRSASISASRRKPHRSASRRSRRNEVNPAEALTVEEALVAYTRGAAAAELMDDRKGTLASGMLADVAILSQDIFTIPPPQLPKAVSVVTIVGGRMVHEAK